MGAASTRRRLFVFQDFKLVPSWTAFDNVAIALEVLGLPSRLVRARVGEALERVGLAGRGGDPAKVLSGGEPGRYSTSDRGASWCSTTAGQLTRRKASAA